MRKRRFVLGSALTFLALLVSSVGAASPAQAYGEIDRHFAEVNTGNCDLISGDLTPIEFPAGCRLNDSADDTFFLKDAGGIGAKVQIHLRNGPMVAKVEFHPYGEKLWIYDTRNDSDTIYVKVCVENAAGTCVNLPPCYSVTGTGDPIDKRIVDLSVAEGRLVAFSIFDESNCTDLLAFSSGRA
jgi:hypothetical protein